MHYITESELRDAYAHQPYDSYELPGDAKLTPSARQFLNDFRIAFDGEGAYAGQDTSGGAHAEATGERAQTVDMNSLLMDAHLLGSRLRLLSRYALGIDNVLAHRCEEIGHGWVAAHVVSDFSDDGSNSMDESHLPGNAPEPPLDARVHPLYFEASVLFAQIARCVRVWNNARSRVATADAEALDAWICEASGACDELASSIDRAREAM